MGATVVIHGRTREKCLSSLERIRRYQHREVGFAARARKCRRDIGFFAFGILHAQDEHVFGQPTLVACHHAGDWT